MLLPIMKMLPLIFLLIIIVNFAAYGKQKKNTNSIIDDVGTEFVVPPHPKRIVSLAPNITEILFYLNAQNKIVGVTENCNYPEKAKLIEKIGGFINPNIEKIVSLKPDLVIATIDGNNPQSIKKLSTLGIKIFVTNTVNLNDIPRVVSLIGHITNSEKIAKEFKKKFNEVISNYKLTNKTLKNVLFLLDINPFITAGKKTLINDIISISGGKNIFDNSTIKYPKIDKESIFTRNPDIILLSKDLAGQNPSFSINNKTAFYIDPDIILRPSPRILVGIKKLREIIKNN